MNNYTFFWLGRFKAILESDELALDETKDLFNGVWSTFNDILHISLGEREAHLFEHLPYESHPLTVKSLPVVDFLLY